MEKTKIELNKFVERWLGSVSSSGNSERTYKAAIRNLFTYFNEYGIESPTKEDLEIWRAKLVAEGKTESTIQLYVVTCRSFFGWLASENLYPDISNKLKGAKVTVTNKRDALTARQAKDLLKSVKGNDEKALRDRAILALLVSCGLRTIEIVRADVEDLRGGFLRVQGKGHSEKDSLVRVPEQVEKLIRLYLAKRQARKVEPLFTSTSNRSKNMRLSTCSIRKFVKVCLRSIGLDDERLSAHSLRHTCATLALLEGASIAQVQQVLRHQDLNGIKIYEHTDGMLEPDRFENPVENIIADLLMK